MPQPSLGSGARRETPRTHLFDDGVTSVGRSSRGFVSQTSPAPIGVNAAPAPSRSCSSPPCRPLRRPFDDFSRFRNPTRPLDDKFFNAIRRARGNPMGETVVFVQSLDTKAAPKLNHVTAFLQLASSTGMHVACSCDRRSRSQAKIRELGTRFPGTG
jgi:hypothetical protein